MTPETTTPPVISGRRSLDSAVGIALRVNPAPHFSTPILRVKFPVVTGEENPLGWQS